MVTFWKRGPAGGGAPGVRAGLLGPPCPSLSDLPGLWAPQALCTMKPAPFSDDSASGVWARFLSKTGLALSLFPPEKPALNARLEILVMYVELKTEVRRFRTKPSIMVVIPA